MATQIPPSKRTEGDGMEKIDKEENINVLKHDLVLPQESKEIEKVSVFLKKTSFNKSTIKNLEFAVQLTPQSFDKKNKSTLEKLKNKEPKFVPYEPYKAAVRPIIPPLQESALQCNGKKKSRDYKNTSNVSKCNILKIGNKVEEKFEAETIKKKFFENEFKNFEIEIQSLKNKNKELENQLKFQVQVNGELKNLLVAAMGEDMETKVHVLTEDKLHLAQALLSSANTLNTHQEQTEWLAGQCEVWKSKFLTSSVMIEELLKWKASLCQKVNEAHDALKNFLDEINFVRENVIKTHRNLCKLRDNFDVHNTKYGSSSYTLTDISMENFKLSEILMQGLLGLEKSDSTNVIYLNYWKQSASEKLAEQVLANSNTHKFIEEADIACNALVGAAVNISGQLYLQSHPPKIECCPKCNGKIKLI